MTIESGASMDSTEHEERHEVQPQADLQVKASRTPLIVRGLMVVLFIAVLIGIYTEQIVQPKQIEHLFKDDLQKLGLAYHEFHRVREHSPASMDELKEFIDNPPPPPKATGIVPPDPVSVVVVPASLEEMVRAGQMIVIWQAALTDSGLENDQYLLAYPVDAIKNGGFALTAAGRALELSADAFKRYPLVTTEQTDKIQTETKPEAPAAEVKK
tara:strand:+ start:70770 stop:71408 length:639 start_codon:yes stop_codon:yes gene_type:complete